MGFKSIKKILDKSFKYIQLDDAWSELLGEVEMNGIWIIYGEEKMGKTTVALRLAEALSVHHRVGYVQAEQGFDADFQNMLIRMNIKVDKRLKFTEYLSIEELDYLLYKKNQPEIIFLDNMTIYADELKYGKLRQLIADHPKKLFIIIAHMDKGDVYTATGKLAKRLAKRIIKVEGARAFVEGRGPGGHIDIIEDKAQLYWGTE